MAIRSLLLPQSRISAQQSVADLENGLDLNDSSRPAYRTRCKARLRRAVVLAGLSLVILGSSGCTSIFNGMQRSIQKQDALNDFMIGHRNRVMAAKAWHCQKHMFCNPSSAFQDGFYAGYADIAAGGNGCIPAIAPSKYWGWMYQSANGAQAVNDWFAGFPMGVQAARLDCVGQWNNVGSSQMRSNPNQMPPAMLPVGAGPVFLDEDNWDANEPMEMTSPFVDDLPQPAAGAKPKGSKSAPGLQDALELGPDEGAMMFDTSEGGVSFTASSSDIPELQAKRARGSAATGKPAEQIDSADLDQVIDSIFGPGPDTYSGSSPASEKTPVMNAATKSSATELPFSFQ